MIDMHDKHEIHISCCPGFISKHKDIFVVSLSFLDTETTKWITALPDFLHPWHILWRINRSLCSMRKVLTTRTQGGTASAAMALALMFLPGIFWLQLIVAPCIVMPSVPVILTIVNIKGVDDLAMQVKFQPQGTTYPAYMWDQDIFLAGTFSWNTMIL